MQIGTRPVIILGMGCTGSKDLLPELMNLGIPVITSWQAIDLVNNYHEAYAGRCGIYGQRAANAILYQSNHVISIGCRLSIWMVGYGEFAPHARLTVCDIDFDELQRFPKADIRHLDARHFIKELLAARIPDISEWQSICRFQRNKYPWIEAIHADTDYINSHGFAAKLQSHMRDDEIVVTDAGSACTGPFQVMRFKPPQRLMTSGGLGEMGCALPAAIGASIASGKRVICFVGDGAMMLNIQELATIRHRNLPIKIFVFANDGYAMIRGTQNTTLDGRYVAVNAATGVWCPDFERVAMAFDIPAFTINSPYDANVALKYLDADGPFITQVNLDPNQVYGPKLQPIKNNDGSISNARFDCMSPLI